MKLIDIAVSGPAAEYARAKYYDEGAGGVRFPADSDLYLLVYDLLSEPPAAGGGGRDGEANLTIALPDRREGRSGGGKDPQRYCHLSRRAQRLLSKRLTLLLSAELHTFVDECKHLRGMSYIDAVYLFMTRYGITTLSEDALLKNYQRWARTCRRTMKRGYQYKS